ncbi:hypothetical protein EJ03DRAFT_163108 [Teratosphaeria nubilosa]|uniref:Uncharacterized protein n=1 Tax=Teratosphaeria nubilosa TaxID=161662 RepID=A0A6G1L375_9PEZI|nr:hypothetical protein EJ03DRAFT_163108 [Teratosphaeria nubilosa]
MAHRHARRQVELETALQHGPRAEGRHTHSFSVLSRCSIVVPSAQQLACGFSSRNIHTKVQVHAVVGVPRMSQLVPPQCLVLQVADAGPCHSTTTYKNNDRDHGRAIPRFRLRTSQGDLASRHIGMVDEGDDGMPVVGGCRWLSRVPCSRHERARLSTELLSLQPAPTALRSGPWRLPLPAKRPTLMPGTPCDWACR